MTLACSYCLAPDGDLLTSQGDPICQRCDARFRAAAVNHQAQMQMALDPTAALTFASPKTLLFAGAGMILGAFVLGVFEVFLMGRVHLLLLGAVFVAGVGALGRGMMR